MVESRKAYHEELDTLGRDVARLGALVTDVIPRGTAVLLEGDLEGAQALVEQHAELAELSRDIESQCHHLLLLQQPVAIDLRTLLAALRLASEIERSGALVVNIAKATRRIYGASFPPRLRGLIEKMSEEATRLYRAAMEAYVDRDAGLAAAIDDMDDTLDELQGDFIEAVFLAEDESHIDLQVAVQLALIARFYERIGDHAVTVGERVQYVVTGGLPHAEDESDGSPESAPDRGGNGRGPSAAPDRPTDHPD